MNSLLPNIALKSESPYFLDQVNFAVTVCDNNGIIVYMNEKSIKTFEKYGGKKLIGSSLYDCHNQVSKEKIQHLLMTGESNIYTTEKQGIKKLIYQTPWHEDCKIMGLMEISIELPVGVLLPHHIRF